MWKLKFKVICTSKTACLVLCRILPNSSTKPSLPSTGPCKAFRTWCRCGDGGVAGIMHHHKVLWFLTISTISHCSSVLIYLPQDSLVGQESSRATAARVAASSTYYLVQLSTKAGEAAAAAHFGKLQVGGWRLTAVTAYIYYAISLPTVLLMKPQVTVLIMKPQVTAHPSLTFRWNS